MAENFLDDLAKFGNNALTAMDSMQRQVRKWASEQVDSAIKGMDIITQEEFDVQKEVLENRIKELEARIAKLEKPAKKTTAPKKKTTKKVSVKRAAPKKKEPLKKAS